MYTYFSLFFVNQGGFGGLRVRWVVGLASKRKGERRIFGWDDVAGCWYTKPNGFKRGGTEGGGQVEKVTRGKMGASSRNQL